MAKPTGGITLSTNFGLNASLPLDARDLIETTADLLLFDKTIIEDGHIVYCKQDSNFYFFDAKEGATGAFKNLFSSNSISQVEDFNGLPSGSTQGTIVYVKNEVTVGGDVKKSGFYIYDGSDWTLFDVSGASTLVFKPDVPTTVDVGGIALGSTFNANTPLNKLVFDLLHPYVEPEVSVVLGPSKEGNYPEANTARLSQIELTSVGGSVAAFKDRLVKMFIDDVEVDLTANGTTVIYSNEYKNCSITLPQDKLFNIILNPDGTVKQSKFIFKFVITVDTHEIIATAYYNFTKPFYHGTTSIKMVDAADEPGLDASTKNDPNAYLKPSHITTMNKITDAPQGDVLAKVGYSTNGEYHVFAYPSSYGNCTNIYDENGFDITNSYKYRTMGGIDSGVEYLVYQSANKCSLQSFTITYTIKDANFK